MDFRDDDNEFPDPEYKFQYPKPDNEFESPEPGPEFDYDSTPLYTDEVFESPEELTDWAQATGREMGYVFVKRRSNANYGGAVKRVTIVCNRSGKRDTRSTGIRGSRKINCPFRLEGHLSDNGDWTVTVVDPRHNHLPVESLEGVAYARRVSVAEQQYVADALDMGTQPHTILGVLKTKFPGNLSRLKEISNFKSSYQKNRPEDMGQTPMQVMFRLLQEGNYLYHHTTDGESGRLRNLFFVHPDSFQVWRAFPWIIEIDATYKTNIYNMPLVEIVGVTSTGRTFSVAYALIENEQEAHYRWVLQCLRSTLDEGFAVRVVLTDRDLALMRACQHVMPEAKNLICRIHIWRNISRHCEPPLHARNKWGPFYQWWTKLVQSRTLTEYSENERQLKSKLADFEKVYNYLQKEWLGPYKEMFVSAWVDEHLNYLNYTTNRVESEHAKLKAELKGRCTFKRILECVNTLVIGQVTEIKGQLEHNRVFLQYRHNIELFKNLHHLVSERGLDIMLEELTRLDKYLKGDWGRCGCKLRTSCGLPCACRLAFYLSNGRRVELSQVDGFWKKLDLSPSTCLPGNDDVKDSDDDDASINEVLDDFKVAIKQQPKPSRKNWLSKIKDILYPGKSKIEDPHVQQKSRGRPIGPKKREKTTAQQPKKPSFFQKSRSMHVRDEPTEEMSNVNVGSSARYPFPARHSSHVPSQSRFAGPTMDTLSSLFGAPMPSPYEGSASEAYCSDQLSQYGARNSEYAPSQSRFATDTTQVPTESTSRFVEDIFQGPHTQFTHMPPPQSHMHYLISEIPEIWRNYVANIFNVASDGNCGFRALAVALGREDSFESLEWVRTEMLAEYNSKKELYDELWGQRDGNRIYTGLQKSYIGQWRPQEYWMRSPNHPILLANRLGLIINCLGMRQSVTVFPFWRGEGEMYVNEPITIALVLGESHFVAVQLQGNYPMAYITPEWTRRITSPEAQKWAEVYKERLDMFDAWVESIRKPPVFCDLTI